MAWGVERWLSALLGPILSLFLAGALLVLIAGALALWIRRLIR